VSMSKRVAHEMGLSTRCQLLTTIPSSSVLGKLRMEPLHHLAVFPCHAHSCGCGMGTSLYYLFLHICTLSR